MAGRNIKKAAGFASGLLRKENRKGEKPEIFPSL